MGSQTGEATGAGPRVAGRGRGRDRAAWAVGTIAAGAVLLLAYLRVAGTVPVLSDGAGNALQAWDMLHGNLPLHGWWVTDVSFYTTELPQYMLVEAVAGLRPEVVHICAALTYTLLAALAAFAARGRARGRAGLAAALIAATIMLAPQPGAPTWILLSSPDHVGTAVPVLVLVLLLDWARPRWYVPVLVCAVLAWAIVADPLTLIVGVAPVTLAALVRVRRGRRSELVLATAAILAVPVALAAERLLRALGGFATNKGVSSLVPLTVLPANVRLTVESLLAIFGADVTAAHGTLNVAFAVVHLAGVALVLGAVAVAGWRLIRYLGGRGELTADVLVIAVVANVAGYFLAFRIPNIYAAHEIGPVLSLGAALAGRVAGGARVWNRPVSRAGAAALAALAAGVACYAAMLAVAATRDQSPPQNAALTAWLTGHGLRSGLGPYWQGTSVTLDSGGRIDMVSVVTDRHGRLAPRHWEADMRLTDPAAHSAGFVVVAPGGVITEAAARRSFGPPARVYRAAGDTIMVWHKNLLRELGPAVS